jgi:hypothetical protein
VIAHICCPFGAILYYPKTTKKQALRLLYQATNGDDWINNDNWLTNNDPCDPNEPWYGITCMNGEVTEIRIGKFV